MNRLPILNNVAKFAISNLKNYKNTNNIIVGNSIISKTISINNINSISNNKLFYTTSNQQPLQTPSSRRTATSIFSSSNSSNTGAGTGTIIGNAGQPIKVQVITSKFRTLLILVIGACAVYYLFFSGGSKDKGGIMSILTAKPFKSVIERPKTTFADVMGAEEAKGELQDLVDFLRQPQKYFEKNIVMPKGILLVGPPGTGKTLLAKSLAGEAQVSFITINGSEFEEAFVGVGARRVRDLFETAKKNSPCIVFIDEIDSVGGSRTKRVNYHPSEALNQLLVELDGFNGREGVMVIAATNYQDSLDQALIRSGRFDRIIQVPLPDGKARKSIIDHYLKDKQLSNRVNTTTIAQSTPGFSGADLFNLVNWAALETTKHNQPEITMEALENAKENLIMGKERHSLLMSDEARKICAYHEAGHALVAILTPGARAVHKATIMPRGDALGMVSMLDKEETFITKKQLIAQMDVAMGGRAAEELILGKDNISQGASSDIQKATSIAQSMVSKYGMSDKVGNIYIQSEKKLSAAQRELVDSEIKLLIDDSYVRATSLLKKHSKEHHLIAKALLEYETLSLDEIKDIIASKSLTNKKNREQLLKEREEIQKKRDTDFKKSSIFKPTQQINPTGFLHQQQQQTQQQQQQNQQQQKPTQNGVVIEITPKKGENDIITSGQLSEENINKIKKQFLEQRIQNQMLQEIEKQLKNESINNNNNNNNNNSNSVSIPIEATNNKNTEKVKSTEIPVSDNKK